MKDRQFFGYASKLSEMDHRYGKNVHLVAEPVLLTELAMLSTHRTHQPEISRLVTSLYRSLMVRVVNQEFPRATVSLETRMREKTPRGVFSGELVHPKTRVVTVAIARAGVPASQSCYDFLNSMLDPTGVRQDYLSISRVVDEDERVTGANISGSKIGGDVEGAFLLIPDPMAATGSSVATALQTYKAQAKGHPKKIIGMHLIVTPEYLRRMKKDFPEVLIYALRLDRGMSEDNILKSLPGSKWDQERGLNEQSYIVPGLGGLGEILNNAFV